MKRKFLIIVLLLFTFFIEASAQQHAASAGSIGVVQILLIIVLAVVGVLVAKDAAKRRMSPWGWGLFVFFVWIIALPLYFILRKPKQENKRFTGGLNEKIGRH